MVPKFKRYSCLVQLVGRIAIFILLRNMFPVGGTQINEKQYLTITFFFYIIHCCVLIVKTLHFRDMILSSSSGGTYSGPNGKG